MKRILLIVIVLIVTSLMMFLIIGIIDKTNKSKMVKERFKTLPHFSMNTINDSVFNSSDIKKGPVLVLFFHPECEHCQYQIKALFGKWDETSGIQVILISNAEKEVIRNFLNINNLFKYPGIIVLVDDSFSFKKYFGTELVPAIFIYDKNLKIAMHFQGEMRPETIFRYLKQDAKY
jgi:thiol-disulfide isomerase/thioredoxin